MAPEYKEANPDAYKENTNWQVAQPADSASRGEWWKIFGDAELNTLEPQVTANNQNLKVADARFREARALIRFTHASLYPTVAVAPFAGGLRQSSHRPYISATSAANSGNGVGDLQIPVDLNYEIDVWGRVRRTVSAAR
jgi:outer membrane protein TolC